MNEAVNVEQLTAFEQNRLDRIPWDVMEKVIGKTKSEILTTKDGGLNVELAKQLANGIPTNYVYANNNGIIAPFSVKVNYFKDDVKLNFFGILSEPDLSVYGQQINSSKAIENLLDKYNYKYTNQDTGEQFNIEKYGQANAEILFPVTKKHEDGTETKTTYLVSFDPIMKRNGKAYRGTNRCFVMSSNEVRSCLDHVCTQFYKHTFTNEEKEALANGKAVPIIGTRSNGEEFKTYVQFSAVQRTVVPCYPKVFRDADRYTSRLGLTQPTTGNTVSQIEETKQSKPQTESATSVAEQKEETKKKSTRKVTKH